MELQDITKSTITEVVFKEMVDQEASPTTRKTTLRVLKKIFQIAFEEGHIQRNPVKGLIVKVPEPKKLVLNGAQAEKLLIEAKAARHPLYYHWAMALFTGMRSGELYGLRWADIDKQRKIISISRQWTSKDGYHPTKTNRNRVFPYSSELESILLELENLGAFKEELRGPSNTSVTFDDLVLPRNNEWRFGCAARLTSEFCTLIGVTPVKFHDLRSTFVTNLLSQGVSAAQVMSLVGHSKISTMEVYLRMAGVDTKGAAEKLSYSLPRQVTDNVLQIS
jgi:integrase